MLYRATMAFDPPECLPVPELFPPHIRLTRSEREIIRLLACGLRNKEIAASLNLTEGTVRVYISRLYDKLGLKDRYELAILGLALYYGAGSKTGAGSAGF